MSLEKVTEEEARRIAQQLYRYDQPATYRAKTLDQVEDKDIHFYNQEGYLIVDRFLEEQQIADAKREIADIIHGKIQGPSVQFVNPYTTDEEKENAVRKINHYAEYGPTLGQITVHNGMLELLEKLLKDKPKNILNQALLKPPFGGGEKPWHQDMAYGNQKYTKQTITLWIALDEANTDNGCMHVIPRSHASGGVPHYQVRDWQICDKYVNIKNDVVVPLQPGGVLIFSGLLHHGTPANFSNKRRWALQLRYAPASARLMSKEEFKLVFTNEMSAADC